MATSGMLLLLLAQFVTPALLIDVTQIEVYPKHGSVAGVFHAWLSSTYAFNASVARDVCKQMDVAMADKAQVETAHAQGFETCKFGWIDEQVAIIPRIHAKDSCGKGRVGIITWRAALSTKFDVFCFNLTDYEARLNAAQETLSSTVMPTAHTSGAHPKLAKTTASRDDLQATSSSFPESVKDSRVNDSCVNDSPESQAISNTSPTTAAGLIALLTTLFAFLVLAVAAICYLKKNHMGRWNKSQQKKSTETEICEKTEQESQAEVKEQHKTLSKADDVSVTIKPEKENGASSQPATTHRPSL